jgi:hypothetical protein
MPVHRVVRVLEKIGTVLFGQTVGKFGRAVGLPMPATGDGILFFASSKGLPSMKPIPFSKRISLFISSHFPFWNLSAPGFWG